MTSQVHETAEFTHINPANFTVSNYHESFGLSSSSKKSIAAVTYHCMKVPLRVFKIHLKNVDNLRKLVHEVPTKE